MTNYTDTRFITWLASHGDIVARVANVHALTPADRADLKQQILIELWRSARRFDGRCAVTTWIYRVALNTALTFRRTEGRRRRRFSAAAREQLEDIPAPDASQTQIQQLYAAIHRLEPIDRSLVLLSLDARSYELMAEVTGLSVANVGARLTRARRKLATLIEDPHNDTGTG